MTTKSFGQVVEFLNRHVETIVLGEEGGGQIVIVPQYQGRTMTSTSRGSEGTSYGWVNFDLIESGEISPVVNLFGGEERFWVSPEGGQYSVFFPPDVDMTFANWRCPPVIDTDEFEVVEKSDRQVSFTKQGTMTNWSGFAFKLQFDRVVKLLTPEEVGVAVGCDLSGLTMVAHESQNTLTNRGDVGWTPETGLIGIWMLNMNMPSDRATMVIPFQGGVLEEKGPIVNADYFGKLDESRLKVDESKSLIYFLGDGQFRSKLGLTFARAKDFLGRCDPVLGVLTIAQFNMPPEAPNGYNNNLWEMQDEPYAGDVINCYNDGQNESGGMLGPFFELETISPALALASGESYCHIHRTIRIEGDRGKVSAVAESVLGVGLDEIESQF